MMAHRIGACRGAAVLALVTCATHAAAQEPRQPATPSAFYQHATPVELTLTANFDRLRRDRQAEPPWRAARVTFVDSAGATRSLPARVRTRGIWRRNNCQMPPLRVDFMRDTVAGTPFAGLDRPKLVQFCQDQARAEQYVLQELQLYRIYQLFTPVSHRARLLRVTYADSGTGRVRTTRYAFFLEEPRALAERVGARELEVSGLVSEDLEPFSRALMGVFQFFIGNTDWSTSGRHNVELFARDGAVYPVAYDFDYSGAVNAHYATPPPQVPIRSVRERVFRGACAPQAAFDSVFTAFRANRAAIAALYEDEVGRLLDRDVVSRTIRYFDEFYEVIDDPAAVKRRILSRCAGSQ